MEKINELESGENARYWVWTYRKIPKISPGAYIFLKALFKGLIFGGAYIRRGLSTEGNLRFKTDWASLIVGRKLTVFALFYFAFEGNFQVQAPRGAYIWRCDLTEGFLRYEFEGLVHGGTYFRNFTVLGSLSNDEGSVNKNAMTFFLLHFSSIHHRA